MKTILITGTSSGIGRAAAMRFQQAGWNVAATMRSPDGETELQKLENTAVLALDVTDPASIQAAVAATLERFGELDVLLNNAGYGLVGPVEAVAPMALERQFATNVYGPVHLIQACLPHFRERKQGVVINVSSIGGLLVLPFNAIYHGTKYAIEGISEAMALELAPLGIRVKIVEPGGVRTDFAGRSLEIAHKEGLHAYDTAIQHVMEVFAAPDRAGAYSEAADIAEVIFTAATDGTDRLRYLAGQDAAAMFDRRSKMSDEDYRDYAIGLFRLAEAS